MAIRFIIIFLFCISAHALEIDTELYQKSNYIDIVTTNSGSYVVYMPSLETEEIKKTKEIKHSYKKRQIKNQSLSVWIWDSRDIDILKLKKNNIKRAYLQVGIGFKEGAKKLYDAKIEVYGLDGAPSYIHDISQIRNDLNLINQINKEKKIINGFQIDIEPYVLKDFNLNKDEYMKKFLQIVTDISTLAHQDNIYFSTVIPFWYDTIYINDRPLSNQIINISDEVTLMSYRTNPAEVVKISVNELNYAETKNKKIKIGIELTSIEDEKHQVYAIKKSQECLNIRVIDLQCLDKKEEYISKGDDISYFNNRDKVSLLLNTKIYYNSFDGFVYHHIKELK